MFKPKVYKSNGLEAYHLVNDEGGSFLYEGIVEYSEGELFKDEQGRTFYLVTTEIGGPTKYYVEVEPEGKPIPTIASKKERDISGLVMASPRETPAARTPAQAPETPPPAAPARDTCFEGPEKVPEKAAEPEAPQPAVAEEAQAAVMAMASLGEHKPNKKSGLFSLPVIIALIIVVIAITIVGIYIYKPGLVSGLNIPFIATPTPEPTAMPEPTPTTTPTPTPGIQQQDLYNSLLAIGPAFDINDTSIVWFATNHTNEAGGSYGKLAKACDLYNYVNGHWTFEANDGEPQHATDSVQTLKGDERDYSILMVSLTRALGLESRAVAAYDGNTIRYHPEIMVASNEADYTEATNYLRGRYNTTDPSVHINGNAYWLSLAMGTKPGIGVNATDEYFVDWKMSIEKL